MASILDLRESSIRLIGEFLAPLNSSPYGFQIHGNRRLPRDLYYRVKRELIPLASTSKRIRNFLSPDLFHCFAVNGEWDVKETFKMRLVELAEMKDVLIHIKHFRFEYFPANCFSTLAVAMKGMKNLEIYSHRAAIVIPKSVAEVFPSLKKLDSFLISEYGVEALPYLNCRPLKYLAIHVHIEPTPLQMSLEFCPITVAVTKRTRNGRVIRGPTEAEQFDAVVTGLVAILKKSRESMKGLEVAGTIYNIPGSGKDWIQSVNNLLPSPLLPALERLEIYSDGSAPALRQLLQDSTNLTHYLIFVYNRVPLGSPPCALPKLKSFRYMHDDDMLETDSMRAYLAASNVEDCMLNGLKQTHLTKLFAPGLESSFVQLRSLELVFQVPHGVFELKQCEMITKATPNLINLKLSSFSYETHAPLYIDILAKNVPNLISLNFDHCWMKPRVSTFPFSDGQTIRSPALGASSFTVMAVVGNTIEEEMEQRVREDVDAVRPLIHRRMLAVARRLPKIEFIKWVATPEVDFHFQFSREGGLKIEWEKTYIDMDNEG